MISTHFRRPAATGFSGTAQVRKAPDNLNFGIKPAFDTVTFGSGRGQGVKRERSEDAVAMEDRLIKRERTESPEPRIKQEGSPSALNNPTHPEEKGEKARSNSPADPQSIPAAPQNALAQEDKIPWGWRLPNTKPDLGFAVYKFAYIQPILEDTIDFAWANRATGISDVYQFNAPTNSQAKSDIITSLNTHLAQANLKIVNVSETPRKNPRYKLLERNR